MMRHLASAKLQITYFATYGAIGRNRRAVGDIATLFTLADANPLLLLRISANSRLFFIFLKISSDGGLNT